jgi:hypothetical protein
MKARLIAVSIFLIIIVIIGLYWYQSSSGPLFHATYKIGDTIPNFPVSEMSLTICNMTISKTTTVPNIESLGSQDTYVVFTVALRNVANHEIYFNRADDFNDRFEKAIGFGTESTFVLTYGAENHQAYVLYSVDTNSQNLYWFSGINKMDDSKIDSMSPNQTIYGVIFFVIGENYTPNELQYKQGLATTPIFTVSLS